MEVSIFPRLAEQLDRFVELRLHTDVPGQKERNQRFIEYQLELTGVRTQPIYVIVDPEHPDKPLGRFDGALPTGASSKPFEDFLTAKYPQPAG